MDKKPGIKACLAYSSIALGLFYGLFARFVFGTDQGKILFEIMSISFIFVVPLVIGFITVFLWPSEVALSVWRWIFYPWWTSALTIVAALVLTWEGLICAVVWVPIFLIMASIGGVIGGIARRKRFPSSSRGMLLASFVVVPFILSPIEQQFAPATRTSVAETQIVINADAATIWENIREVPAIREDEQGFSIAHLIGFPKPIAAKLTGEGVGAVRHATFKGDVLFVETVTEWEPLRRLSFTIEPSPDIPPTTFDEHVVVGGQYFDVLSGSYRIEPLGPRQFVLHLSSEHRLATRFNWYARIWAASFMSDIQMHILEVIKKRCEQRGA